MGRRSDFLMGVGHCRRCCNIGKGWHVVYVDVVMADKVHGSCWVWGL